MEKWTSINTIGCLSDRIKSKLLTMPRRLDIHQTKETKIISLPSRVTKRSAVSISDVTVKADLENLRDTCHLLDITGVVTMNKVRKNWFNEGKHRIRIVLELRSSLRIPPLSLMIVEWRRTVIKWFYGTLPII